MGSRLGADETQLEQLSPLTLLAIELAASNGVLWAALAATGRARHGARVMARLSLPGLFQPGLAYAVLARRDVRRHDPLLLTGLHQISGLALILVLRAVWPMSNNGSVVSAGGIFEAIAAGVCLFSAPFWLYLRSLQLLGASKAAQLLTIEPVLAVPLALTFLGEAFTTTQVVGSAVTIVAMFAMAAFDWRPVQVEQLPSDRRNGVARTHLGALSRSHARSSSPV